MLLMLVYHGNNLIQELNKIYKSICLYWKKSNKNCWKMMEFIVLIKTTMTKITITMTTIITTMTTTLIITTLIIIIPKKLKLITH